MIGSCKSTLAYIGKERQLSVVRPTVLINQGGWIVAGETMVGILRRAWIAPLVAQCLVDPVHRQERQAARPDEGAHFLHAHVGGQQLGGARRVDAVEVRMGDRKSVCRERV